MVHWPTKCSLVQSPCIHPLYKTWNSRKTFREYILYFIVNKNEIILQSEGGVNFQSEDCNFTILLFNGVSKVSINKSVFDILYIVFHAAVQICDLDACASIKFAKCVSIMFCKINVLCFYLFLLGNLYKPIVACHL